MRLGKGAHNDSISGCIQTINKAMPATELLMDSRCDNRRKVCRKAVTALLVQMLAVFDWWDSRVVVVEDVRCIVEAYVNVDAQSEAFGTSCGQVEAK